MKTAFLNTRAFSSSFGCALTKEEEKDFSKTQNEAKKALGIDTGISLFKVFPQSLPQNPNEYTGVGKLNSDNALKYIKFMKLYTGANAIKEFPIGQMTRHQGHYFGPYNRNTSIIGEDSINLFKLTTKEYGKLLSQDEVEKFVVPISKTINFEHELGLSEDFPILKPLKIAYDNMLAKDTPEALNLREEFETYKSALTSDSYERFALYPFIAKNEPNLFKEFDNSAQKQKLFAEYKEEYVDEIDFFKFRKFVATKNHQEAIEKIHQEHLELYGDCPIGFSPQEVWAHPDAFYPEHITPGWNFRAINYEDIVKENTPASRLFKEKISFYLENYDGVRFDVGWQYFKPNVKDFSDKENPKPHETNVGDGILEFIENTAREIKGQNYDTRKLMYESDAGADDYQLFDWANDKASPKASLKNRTPVLTTQYENGNGFGWGNPQFLKKAGLQDYMIGTNNHDGAPLRSLAEDEIDYSGEIITPLTEIRKTNIKALKKSLNLSKKEAKMLENPKNFVKAKFGEIFTAKNQFVFFNDVMGNKERTDTEELNPKNYRLQIGQDYEREYHSALQNGDGFNLMESLRIAIKAKGLNTREKELYNRVSKYSSYLALEGPKTREEAEAKAARFSYKA